MANTMQFDLVSPERRLASLEAREVRLPASEGEMTTMPDHAPVIATLRPGVVTVTGADGGTSSFAVTGGFAEITPEGASVLAERAYPATSENRSAIEAVLAEARKQAESAEPEHKDAAQLIVDDLAQLVGDMA
ncbi:MAG: F0F1 ATP synthase subunit epsilon [Pseudomonadota bacterium]